MLIVNKKTTVTISYKSKQFMNQKMDTYFILTQCTLVYIFTVNKKSLFAL